LIIQKEFGFRRHFARTLRSLIGAANEWRRASHHGGGRRRPHGQVSESDLRILQSSSPGNVGQHQVENDQRGRFFAGAALSARAFRSSDDVNNVRAIERSSDQFHHARLVFDDEKLFGRAGWHT
jgi:hypothetical protein